MSADPNEGRSTGRLVSLHKALPAVEVDCSGWAAGATVWLELVVSFDQRTPPARVMEHANQLIAAAARAAPELGLTYDFTRSRAEKGDVVIALTPRNTTDVERRLKEVAEVFRGETARSDEVRRLVATVAHAA